MFRSGQGQLCPSFTLPLQSLGRRNGCQDANPSIVTWSLIGVVCFKGKEMQRSIALFTILVVTVPQVQAANSVLFQFDAAGSAKPWQTVNDGVMGGRSVGRFRINQDKNMEFYGYLSLANNGGFASVRARGIQWKLSKGDVIVARVRGDGREYKFNVYTRSDLRGYSFRQSFRTKKGEWTEVRLPMHRFVATWRGRTFPNEKLDPSKVAGLGILLGDKKAGPFKLEVDWIKVSQ